MGYTALTTANCDVDKPLTAETMQIVKDDFDYLYGLQSSPNDLINGSFEIDADSNGVPDNWSVSYYTAGTGGFDTSTPSHGAQAFKFIRTTGVGNGGGYLDSPYFEVSTASENAVAFDIKAGSSKIRAKVCIRHFGATKNDLGTVSTVYDSTANPTSWARYVYTIPPVSSAKFVKVRLIGGATDKDIGSTVFFDDVRIQRAITQSMLKTTYGTVSVAAGNALLPGGEYGFYPQISMAQPTSAHHSAAILTTLAAPVSTVLYTGVAAMKETVNFRQRYITQSGRDRWVFFQYDHDASRIISYYSAKNHPCYGNSNDPEKMPIPFARPQSTNIKTYLLDGTANTILESESRKQDRTIQDVLRKDYAIDFDNPEDKWMPRDMDGKRKLKVKSPLYQVVRIKKREG